MCTRRCIVSICSVLFSAGVASARPPVEPQELAPTESDIDMVGDVDGKYLAPQKVLADTVWIADWSFDTFGPCDATGWAHVDNHIRNDGSHYWHIESTAFSGVRTIVGQSAGLGYHNNSCCEDLSGYDNDWYYGIRMTYQGAATLSFDYLVDSETASDFVQIETDSACASFERVDYINAPGRNAASYRIVLFHTSGYNGPPSNSGSAHVGNQALADYGAGTHCVYISFVADGAYSPCDGIIPTTLGEGA